LSPELVRSLAARLRSFWQRYRMCFRTQTRDGSEYAFDYLSGQLRLETKRTFANLARTAAVSEQNMQHFMSNSPWSAQAVFRQVQAEIIATPALQSGGVLVLDESAEAKSGDQSAGAARQHNGRLGKVDMSQVGTFLTYVNGPVWTWIDGELFLPESWFASDKADLRQRLGIPDERTFATKVDLGWQMIQRALCTDLTFELLACDDLYGRVRWFRAALDQAGITYMADVPSNTQVYVDQPWVGVPSGPVGGIGRPPVQPQVRSAWPPVTVAELAQRDETERLTIRVRATERGEITGPFAFRRVWTISDAWAVREEWLCMRWEADGDCTYSLSNAPFDVPMDRLALLKCMRYFGERSHQDAKSEVGFDDLQARTYRAWEHHLALTVLATWFVAQTKLDWQQQKQHDPSLTQAFAADALPALSMANVRALLRSVMPLPELTPEEATRQVVKHLVNRTRSRKSRMGKCARSP
jgi:SRSO17 transposase